MKNLLSIIVLAITPMLSIAQLNLVGTLNDTLWESSGLEHIEGSTVPFYTINDGGNSPVVFALDRSGKITHSCFINAQNTDWESLTSDDSGYLYIGDFGNNLNTRRDLQILKVHESELSSDSAFEYRSIQFRYKNQKVYPPPDDKLLFDCEAMFWHADSLFLITKNRTNPYNGWLYMYGLPDHGMQYEIEPLDSIFTGDGPMIANWVTDATFDGQKIFILIQTGIIQIPFSDSNWQFGDSMVKQIFDKNRQYEAIELFENEIYLTCETSFLGPAALWKFTQAATSTEKINSKSKFIATVGQHTIQVKGSIDRLPSEINLYDLSGKKVKYHYFDLDYSRVNANGNEWTQELTHIPSGVWFLEVLDQFSQYEIFRLVVF